MVSVMMLALLTSSANAPSWGFGCHGCYGCHGCHGCSGYYGCGGCYVPPVYAPTAFAPAYPPAYAPAYPVIGAELAAPLPTQARVIVNVPSEARVSLNGPPMKQATSVRRFVTPSLEPGRKYFYTVKAEVLRNGKPVEETKQVELSAGQEVRVDFGPLNLAEQSTSQPAHVVVKLPREARLFVDGVPCPLTAGTRSFDTPAIPFGKSFYYTLKGEVDRQRTTYSEDVKVVLQAGKRVSVNFDNLLSAQTTSRK